MRRGRGPVERPPRELDVQIDRALAEDRFRLDRTSRAVLPSRTRLTARIVAQGPGVVSGVAVARRVAQRGGVSARVVLRDGSTIARGSVVLRFAGDARAVLGVERTALNFLMHLSGVATQTRAAVRAAQGRLEILATRKTLPGLRDLEKAAVVHGGGRPHRRDLSDAILVKSTHVSLVGLETAVRRAVAASRGDRPVEVEVRTPAEAVRAARAGAPGLLLDNATPTRARATVRALVRAGLRRGVRIELSGGITSANLPSFRRVGADAASLGSLTHSAPAVPFHLVVDRVLPRGLHRLKKRRRLVRR